MNQQDIERIRNTHELLTIRLDLAIQGLNGEKQMPIEHIASYIRMAHLQNGWLKDELNAALAEKGSGDKNEMGDG